MAKSFILVDDIDGTHHAVPVRIMLNGEEFFLDLAEHNLERLREKLKPFIMRAFYVPKSQYCHESKKKSYSNQPKGAK